MFYKCNTFANSLLIVCQLPAWFHYHIFLAQENSICVQMINCTFGHITEFYLCTFNYIFVFLSYIFILGMFFPKRCLMFDVASIPSLLPCSSFTINYNWCAWNIRLFLTTLYFLLLISYSPPQYLESSNLSFNHNFNQ